jgi:hypothetical protein
MILLSNPHSVWLDAMCLAASATLLEAAATGRGTTIGRGTINRWRVVSWLRPILAVIGLGLLSFAAVDFLNRFLN